MCIIFVIFKHASSKGIKEATRNYLGFFLTGSWDVYKLILKYNINITPYNDPTMPKPEGFPGITCLL